MDPKLLAWGLRQRPARMPALWLFTDQHRLADPRSSVDRLPRGKAGVVLRHDHDPERATLARDLARICRRRRLVMTIAGDVRLAAAMRAGVHLRSGQWPGPLRVRGVVTSSAHTLSALRRARQSAVDLVFLSPVFPTASHVGAPGLGPLRWAAMIRHMRRSLGGKRPTIAALGGIDGGSVRRLRPSICRTIGAITALS